MSIEEIFQTMQELVAEQFAMEPSEVTMETSFEEDLGADSVDLVELVMAMEEEFEMGEVQEEDLGKLKTVFQMSATIALLLLVPVSGAPLLGHFGVVLANVLMYIAVVSPSRLEFVAIITSLTSFSSRTISSLSLMSCGPIPSIGEIAP